MKGIVIIKPAGSFPSAVLTAPAAHVGPLVYTSGAVIPKYYSETEGTRHIVNH